MADLEGPNNSPTVFPNPSRQLSAREQELAAIYEQVPGILFYIRIEAGGEFRFLAMSRAGLEATGLTREQFVGALVRDVIPPASRELVLEHYRDAVRSGRTVRWKDVSTYPAGQKTGEVAVTPLYDAHGVATHLVGVVHDVTDHERLEQAFYDREERLAFRIRLNDALRPLHDPVEIQDVTVRLLGEYLGVNRVAYSVVEGDAFIVTTSLRERGAAASRPVANQRLRRDGARRVPAQRPGDVQRCADRPAVDGRRARELVGIWHRGVSARHAAQGGPASRRVRRERPDAARLDTQRGHAGSGDGGTHVVGRGACVHRGRVARACPTAACRAQRLGSGVVDPEHRYGRGRLGRRGSSAIRARPG
jgi:PAS domain S-box-containing protein